MSGGGGREKVLFFWGVAGGEGSFLGGGGENAFFFWGGLGKVAFFLGGEGARMGKVVFFLFL